MGRLLAAGSVMWAKVGGPWPSRCPPCILHGRRAGSSKQRKQRNPRLITIFFNTDGEPSRRQRPALGSFVAA